jgi:hypothetical protein
MLFRLFRRVFRRGFQSPRVIVDLGAMQNLARTGMASWLIAQEKARLDYLAAKEKYTTSNTSQAFDYMLEMLLQLQSTNAFVQALLNEHQIERLMAEEPEESDFHIGKSR